MEFSLFSNLEHEKTAQDKANKVSLTVAQKRVDDHFGHYLSNAQDRQEFAARLEVAEPDIRQAIHSACDEYGGQHELIYNHVVAGIKIAAKEKFIPFKKKEDEDEEEGEEEDGKKEASVKTARRPKLCPYHSEVMDISLTAGDPQAGFNSMSQHAWGPKHCQGEFDGSCNFKREMVTQDYWDKQAEKADERRQEREVQREHDRAQSFMPEPAEEEIFDGDFAADEPTLDDALEDAPSAVTEVSVDAEPAMALAALAKLVNPNLPHTGAKWPQQTDHEVVYNPHDGYPEDVRPVGPKRFPWEEGAEPEGYGQHDPYMDGPHRDNPSYIDQFREFPPGPGTNPRGVGQIDADPSVSKEDYLNYIMQEPPRRAAVEVEAAGANPPAGSATLKREEISPKPGKGNLGEGGPETKMDKRKWTPENVRDPEDVDNPNGPHATEHKDIMEPAKYDQGPFVNEPPEHAMSPVMERQDINKKIKTDKTPTKSWSGQKGQQNPVTRNPVSKLIDSGYDGFSPSQAVEDAIQAWHRK